METQINRLRICVSFFIVILSANCQFDLFYPHFHSKLYICQKLKHDFGITGYF